MRALLILVLTGSAHAAPLDKAETLTILLVDAAGHGYCEPWRVDPAKHQLVATDATRTYSVTADHVDLDGITDDAGTRVCNVSRPAQDHADELVVDGASWFRNPRSCAIAVVRNDPVATDLGDCETSIPPTTKQVAATRARFERLMARGGTVFTIATTGTPRCQAETVRVDRESSSSNTLAASFVSVYEDAEQRTVTARPFRMTPGGDTLDRLNAEVTTVYKKPPEIGTGRYACVCIEREPLVLAADSFDLEGTYYFTLARCKAAIDAAAARLTWWPTPEKRWGW